MTPGEQRLEAMRQRGRDSVRNPRKRPGPSADILARAALYVDAFIEGAQQAEREPDSNILTFPER